MYLFFKKILLKIHRLYYYLYYLKVKYFKLGFSKFMFDCGQVDFKIDLLRHGNNIIGEKVQLSSKNTYMFNKNLDVNFIIGDRVSIAQNCTFFTISAPNDSILATHPETKKYSKSGPITVGDDTWIGVGVIIHPDITIGKNCIIGSMSNVTRNIPNNSLAVGNPCKVIKTFNI